MHLLLACASNFIRGALSQSPTTPSQPAQTHKVLVSKGDHVFDPDTIDANIGDVVEFEFYPKNHSVVRADYLTPCVPYEKMGPRRTGFFSGFYPVDEITDNVCGPRCLE